VRAPTLGRLASAAALVGAVALTVSASAVTTAVAAPAAVTPSAEAWNGIWGWDSASSGATVLNVGAAIGVDYLQKLGLTGKGVSVALIDTGIARVPGLDAGTVVDGPDLSFDSQDPATRYRDLYGHGTHLAGIIGGNKTGLRGITSQAKIVNVKVGAANGAVDVVQVLAGIDWVVEHRNDDAANPIKVICLAYGTDSSQVYTASPLALAVENAWKAGITVVVSAGNAGSALGRLNAPANDPFVIAVGATDIAGTEDVADDTAPSYSSRGSSTRGVDIAAPGQSIVSLRDPGSYIDVNYPGARVGADLFRGSGTSQSAAVVAGTAALMYQQRPGLTPDQVKQLLRSTAYDTTANNNKALSDAWGVGEIIGGETYAQQPPTAAPPTRVWSTGTGTLDAARGTTRVTADGIALSGEKDIFGNAFSTSAWAAASKAGNSWVGGTWMGAALTGDGWVSTTGGQRAWSGRAWSGRAWSGRAWSGRAWSGEAWLGQSWMIKS
jgi:serine protease AprX